jgi:hypothetical protein
MMKRFISVGLFENHNGKITCLKVAKRLMSSATSNPQMRSIIQNIKTHHDMPSNNQSHDGIMTASQIIRQDKIRLDNIDKKTPIRDKSLDNGFEEFWQSYPKKVGKDGALKSWLKTKARIDDVLQALAWQKESDQWRRSDGQFIPNPATYLNQGRWQDERPVDASPF